MVNKRATKFTYQYFFCFVDIIDVGMIAIALIGQLLHFIVLVIAHAITQHAEENAAFSFFFNQAYQFIIAAGPYVKITISSKDHPVIAIFG